MYPAAPVIEITGDDDRLASEGAAAKRVQNKFDLTRAPALRQAQMHTQAMNRRRPDAHHRMQQAAALEPVHRHVVVVYRLDRIARQNRIAMMPVRIHRIAAIVHFGPQRSGQKAALRFRRPVGEACRVAFVRFLHFLQEHQFGGECMQCVAYVMHDHPPVQR